MARISLRVDVENYRLSAPFRISGHVFEDSDVVVVTLDQDGVRGRGEGAGVFYMNDDVDHMLAELERHRGLIEAGIDREALRDAMPAGGARNAVDCALWDLEARKTGVPAWQRAGLALPRPLVTTFTLGADSPEIMAEGAVRFAQARSLKLKLTGEIDLDIERVRAVRKARPDTWIGVDANQGFVVDDLDRLVAAIVESNVSLIEQPLARGREADLEGYRSPIPIAADESVLTLADVPGLVGRFDVVNIKLDKCGGLTEALLIAEEAKRLGLGVMVGNMVSTSLAMAPAFVVGQLCEVVDLDGPIFLAEDRKPSIVYEDGRVWAGEEIWGGGAREG